MDLNQLSRNLIENNGEDRYYSTNLHPEGGSVGLEPISIVQTTSFKTLYRYVGNEGLTRAILSSIFWDLLSSSMYFLEILLNSKNKKISGKGAKLILTMQLDKLKYDRFDLLVLSPEIRKNEGFASSLSEAMYISVRRGYFSYDSLIHDLYILLEKRIYEIDAENVGISDGTLYLEDNKWSQYLKIISDPNPYFIEELLNLDFRIIFAPLPETIFTTGVPSPACGIELDKTGNAYSSVGVVARNANGHIGVTGAFHGMHSDPEELSKQYHLHGVACLLGKEVYVNGKKGVILDADEITDSCFIGLEEGDIPPSTSYLGPMITRPPYKTEEVYFEGITSAKVNTNITEIDVGIPGVARGRQRCVYTKAVTNRGDSGSALVNSQGEVVGFSFRRTGYGELIEFSEWIWADSVFKTLQLSKP